MPAKIISGKEIAAEIRADLKPEVEQLKADLAAFRREYEERAVVEVTNDTRAGR